MMVILPGLDDQGVIRPLTGDDAEYTCLWNYRGEEECLAVTCRQLASIYQEHGEYEASQTCLKIYVGEVDRAQSKISGHTMLGQLSECQGDYQEAVDHYREALQHDPGYGDFRYWALNNLGYSLLQLGRYEESLGVLKEADATPYKFANARKNMGLVYAAQGRLNDAAEEYLDVTIRNPGDSRAFDLLKNLIDEHPNLICQIDQFWDKVKQCYERLEEARIEQRLIADEQRSG